MFCSRCGTRAPDDSTSCALCGLGAPARVTPVSASPTVATAVEVAYGGFWRRFVAAAVDGIVLFFPAATLRVLLGLNPIAVFDPDTPASFVAGACQLALDWLYAAWLIQSSARGTLGQQLLGLEVTNLQGERVSFARATLRYFAQALSVLTMGVGYLLQLVTPRRQTLHDVVSATLVVRARSQHVSTLLPAVGPVS